jgi:hypothetical protein
MKDKIQFEESYAQFEEPCAPSGETIKEQHGQWWWADEIQNWHGPCSTLESAQKRQALYVGDLQGVYNFVTQSDWEARENGADPGTLHPCNAAQPWDCDCAGACSCHWETDP